MLKGLFATILALGIALNGLADTTIYAEGSQSFGGAYTCNLVRNSTFETLTANYSLSLNDTANSGIVGNESDIQGYESEKALKIVQDGTKPLQARYELKTGGAEMIKYAAKYLNAYSGQEMLFRAKVKNIGGSDKIAVAVHNALCSPNISCKTTADAKEGEWTELTALLTIPEQEYSGSANSMTSIRVYADVSAKTNCSFLIDDVELKLKVNDYAYANAVAQSGCESAYDITQYGTDCKAYYTTSGSVNLNYQNSVVHSGSRALSVAAGSLQGIYLMYPFESGKTYLISYWVKTDSATEIKLRNTLWNYNRDTDTIERTNAATLITKTGLDNTDGWTRVNSAVTINYNNCDVPFLAFESLVSGATFYIDDIEIRERPADYGGWQTSAVQDGTHVLFNFNQEIDKWCLYDGNTIKSGIVCADGKALDVSEIKSLDTYIDSNGVGIIDIQFANDCFEPGTLHTISLSPDSADKRLKFVWTSGCEFTRSLNFYSTTENGAAYFGSSSAVYDSGSQNVSITAELNSIVKREQPADVIFAVYDGNELKSIAIQSYSDINNINEPLTCTLDGDAGNAAAVIVVSSMNNMVPLAPCALTTVVSEENN